MAKRGIKKIEDWKHLGKADLHIHTNFSDGRPSVEQILDYVQNFTDLDVIAITDHDTIEGALLAQKLMLEKYFRFELIIGEEISTLDGHILGLFLTQKINPGLSAHETIKAIHAQGGLAIAPHPFESYKFQNPDMITMKGVGAQVLIKEHHHFNAIEIVNATPTLNDENIKASILNKTLLGRAETGSSDAHILEAIGRGYTLFEGKSVRDFKKAILHRQTQALHTDWTIMALFKYLFFFIPYGFRILIYNILHRTPFALK